MLSYRVDYSYQPSRTMRVLAHFTIVLFFVGQLQAAVAGTRVVTSQGWSTTAITNGNITEITNAKKIGSNTAYNSFDHFGVASGHITNFRLDGANNLVNLVRASRTDIDGILNSYLGAGNTIGGNVFFVNPHGITVGAQGVVNVGSLSMVVPTQSAMDDYISALQNAGSTADDRLLFVGGLKLAEDGEIDIKGTINAQGGVLLLANNVNVSGSVNAGENNSGIVSNGNINDSGADLFAALVKVSDDFQDELGIFEVDGEIVIGAVGASEGVIDDLNPVKGTSANITITDSASIQADGTIQISAVAKQNPTSIDNGLVEWNTTSATVDIDGATITSDSDAVVISANSIVDLEVGGFDGLPIAAAIAKSDTESRVRVVGASKINVATDVTISSSSKTDISATANAESSIATLTIAAANVDSDSSAVVAGTTTIGAGGAVSVNSVSDARVEVMADGLLSDGSGGGLAIAITDVDSTSIAGISGGAQILNSGSVAVTSSVANSIDTAARSVVTGDPQSISEAVNSQANLDDNTTGEPDGLKVNIDTALDDSFEVEDDGQASSPQLAAAFAYTSIDSSSVATIDAGIDDVTGAEVNSTGAVDVVAKSMTDASNLAQGKTAVGADASITAGVSILTSKEVIRAIVAPTVGNLTVSGNSLNVSALNEDYSSLDNSVAEMVSTAYAGSGGGGDLGIAGAFAINLQDRDSVASIVGDSTLTIDVDGNLDVAASSNVSDAVVASATLSEQEAQDAEEKFAANSAAQQDAEMPVANPDEGGAAGVGAAMAINVVTNTTDARIGSGVIVVTPSNVTVDANSKADAAVSSKAGVAAEAEGGSQAAVGVGASVAVSVVTDNTNAEIETNDVALLSGGEVSVRASHEGAINVMSDGSAAGDNAAIGASIAISVTDANTQALLSRDVSVASVDIAAGSNTSNTTVAKASASGAASEEEPAEPPADGEKAGVDKKAADLTKFAGDKKEGGSAQDPVSESAETPGGAVAVAAGLAVTVTEATVNAENTGNIITTGLTNISSAAVADSTAEADGSAVNGSNIVGIGAAVAVNTLTQSNTATARNINSSNGLSVAATQIEDEENDFGAVATSGAGAANVGVAGSVAVNVVSNKSLATYENGEVSGGAVDIDALNKSNSVTRAGATIEGEGDSVGVGVGVAIDVVVSEILAVITADANVSASSSVAVDANSSFTADLKSEAGQQGEASAGGSVGVSGTVAVGVYSNKTRAEIAAASSVLASAGVVHVDASHSNKINVETGADAAGDKAAIGASIAIAVSNVETEAVISRDVSADSVTITASSSTSNATKAKASASGAAPEDDTTTPEEEKPSVNKDIASWQTFASDKDDSGSTASTETEDPDASSSEGQVSVAAAVAVTVTDVDTVARIDNDVNITAANDVEVTASANTDAQGTADGSAANGGVGVGVGVAINVANNNNTAYISQGADVQGGNISVLAIMMDDLVEGQTDPDTVNTFGADATSGAGAAKVGVAGSLALNIVTNESRAYIAGNEDLGTAAKVYTEGNLSLAVTNNASHDTKAKASVGGDADDPGKGVGIGASVAINTITNKANIEIRDGVLIAGDRDVATTEAGSLTMASSSQYTTETKAEAGAEGEEGADPSNDIAVDAAVALVVADNETKTSIGDVNTSAGFSGDIDLDSSSDQSNTTEANGDTAGSSVAIGAVAAVNIGVSNTAITVNTDLKTSAGSITMDAVSTSADKALAKASARGASKKKAQDKYGATEEEVDAGDFGDGAEDNKAASADVLARNAGAMEQKDTGDDDVDGQNEDKGDWSVSIAAAVGANVVDNDTSVIVTSGQTLGAANSIDINASSDSNYMTLGSGEAVAVSEGSSDSESESGGGIGIGVGVAITVAQNDTVVEVSSIEAAGDVSIAANSTQNMHEDFIKELTSEAIAGASADTVALAGAVATVVTDNNTRAEINDGATIGDIGALSVTADDQSKISSRAIAWVDPEEGTSAGVGASAAILVSKNKNTASIGDGVIINSADSINVAATNHRVTPETVGLDFSEIINFDDILESALLAGRTEASEDDEDNTGTEPEVDPETGGPAIIFDKLESTATDAKHALEDYIRSHNYYTEAAAGSASTEGAAKYGAAGSFAVTVLQNETQASIGNVTVKNVKGDVAVTADTATNIAGFTGSVVKAGSVGVGVSATTLVNLDSTRALVGNDAVAAGIASLGSADVAANIGNLNVSASSDQDILGIGVSAAAAGGSSDDDGKKSGGVAVSGVLNTTILVNKVEAKIANDTKVYSTGSVALDAEGMTDIVSVVGGIALAEKVGVGASVGTSVISGQTKAAIGDGATVVAADSVAVVAAAEENIISIVVGAGASKKVGVAGSLATNIIAASTTATIGSDAVVTQTNARNAGNELNAIAVHASDNTNLFSLAGGGAIGGKAGVGAAADVAVFSKNTIAETKAGSVLIAGGNVDVSAKSKDDIISLTGAGAASSSGAAVAGVASVKVVVDKTHALINSDSVVADGNVDLLAQSDTDLNIYDGTIAISGGSAGVGGAVAVNTLVKDTAARVGEGVAITARGDLDDSQIYNGDVDRSDYLSVGSIVRPDSEDEPSIGVNAGELTDAEKQTSANRGLSVTAFSTEDIETIGISASASKSVAVAGNLAVDVIANKTDAAIGAGATVNAIGLDAANNSASVLVQSYDYTDLNAMLGSGAVGVSSAGVGAAGDVSSVIKKTTAHIDANADIDAEQDVSVLAGSEEDIDSIAAAVGVGSSAGVSGAASVLVINSETRAYTESNLDSNKTNIDAGRDFTVEAEDRTDLFVFNTALAAGSTAGVGGSAGVVVLTNTTEVKVGRGTVSNADRRSVVRADSDENLIGIAMGAAGGGSAGVSGQLGIHVLATNTDAIVEDGVTINKESWNDAGDEDEQSVAVVASNDVELVSISGTVSLGGSAGVGGALTADVVLNKVRASVGDSEVYAGSAGNGNVDLGDGLIVEDGVSIRATSQKDIVAVSVAGSGGGSAGVAGAASLLIVGSDYDEGDETSDSFGSDMDTFTSTGEGGEESSQLAQADSGSESRTADTLGAQGDVEVSKDVSVAQYVDDNSQSSGSGYFTLDSADDTSGDTVAVVASGAIIRTKGDLEISANDDTTLTVVGGSVAVGGSAGVAGAGALVLLNQGTRAIVQDDDLVAVELDAARNMNVNAQADSQIVDVTATVAAGGGAGVSGSLLLNVVDSRSEARIGDGALINQDGNIVADSDQSVIVDANNSTNVVATTANGSGSGTAAVGGVAMANVIVSRTSASIGKSAQVKAQRDVMVIADSSEQVIANGASAAISGVAGVGGVINANTIISKTDAVIESDALVDSDGNVLVAAEDDTSLISNAWGVAIGLGGAGVGGSFGVNTIVKDTNARISEGVTVYARGNNAATMDVYTGELVDPVAGDNLIEGLISRIESDEPEEPEESDSSSGPSDAQSQGQADKWQSVVDDSGANKNEEDLLEADEPSLSNIKKSRVSIRGLAVVASSTEDIVSSNASAAGGLYAGVSGSGQVLSVVADTDATIEKGVTIESKDLLLSASDHTRSLSVSGGLAISGVAGVGGVIVSGNIIKSTNATLGSDSVTGNGVDVTATGDVIVDADSSDDIDEILVNVAGAGIAGVGGGVASHVAVSETTAEVGNNAVIDGDSDLRVRADSNTEIDTFSGNLSLAGIAAVGGVVSSNVVANTTTARIGDSAKTDADDVTEVSADSVSNVDTITVAASGGAVGVAGDVAVNVVTTTAQSSIGQNALLNTEGTGNASQDVLVTAADSSTINSDTGTIALGAVAVGGALSVDILRNSASATIGNNAQVNANNSIDVSASTVKTLDSKVVSAAAGGFGMSGSIAVAAIGGDLNDDAYEQINGEDDNGNTNTESGSINKAGSSSGVNPLASDDENSQLNDFNATSSLADDVDQRNTDREAEYGVSDDVASSADPRSGTLAAVGSGVILKAGGNLNVTAEDTTTTNMLAGAVGVGAVAGAGAAAITVVSNTTEAMIASNATLDSGADLTVSAANNKTLNATAASGAASFANSMAGSIGVTVDSSTAKAHVDSGARINQDSITRALASQQNVNVKAINNANIDVKTGAVSASLGTGIGGTLNVVTTSQTTEALINVGATGRVSAEGLINVDADSIATSNAQSAVGAGGLAAGIAGGAVTLFDDSITIASIGDGSVIDEADEVEIDAQSTRTTTADTKGAAIGAVGVGGSVSTIEMEGVTTASVADNAKLGTDGAIIGSLSVNATATETATAKAVALAAGIISGAGGVATSRINSTISASNGRNTDIVATGEVGVTAQATPKALSRSTAGSFGAATVGASMALVDVAPTVTATIDGSDIEAGSLIVSAKVLDPSVGRNADAYAEAASGGLLLGANATIADTSVKGSARTLLTTGSILNIAGDAAITATHNSDQYAETKSFAAGLAALGGAFSSGTTDTVSQVYIADGTDITTDDLTVSAIGDDKNQVKAKSGSGGAVAGAAAVAETNNISQTTVSIGNGQIVAGNVDIDAVHTARFDHEADSTSGGLLGASGAVADNLVDAQVEVNLAGSILAKSFDARSHNNVYKNLLSGFNVEAGAGGLLGGAAADSETDISRMTSHVKVAGDSSLIINQDGNTLNGDTVLEAGNTLVADDRAKLDSGGAIAIALVETSIKTTGVGISAGVDIGDATTTEMVLKADGNITAAAFSDVNVSTSANASTYGLAGAAQGQSTSLIQMANSIDVRNLTSMESGEETHLRVGRKADGSALTHNVTATTDLWNKTAFPVENDPQADAFLLNLNTLNVESTAVVAAAGDIYLTTDKGSRNVRGVGTGKDLYRQALEDTVNFFGGLVGADDVSFDITGGSSTDLSSEAVTVNGLVNAGIDNKLKFEIRRLANGDLAFYEGSWDPIVDTNAEVAFFAALTPTLTLQVGPDGLVAIDAESNSVPVTFDAATNTFSIASSENGLSTSVALEADFNPLDKLQERLTAIGLELEALKISAGSFTQDEIDDRADFLDDSLNALAERDVLKSLRDSIQVIDASTPIEDNQLAGYSWLISRIDAVDTIFASETIVTATDLEVWNLQVQGLERTKVEIDNSPITADDKANVIADVDRQISEVQTNLLDTSSVINAQINIIKGLEADTAANPGNAAANNILIANARILISTQRGTIDGYRALLDGRVSDIGTDVIRLKGVSDAALASRELITGTGTTEASLQPKIKRLDQEQVWIDRRIAEYDGGAGYELIDFTDKLSARSANIYVESDNLTGASNLVANRDTEVSVHNQSEAYMRISGGAEIPFAAGGGVFNNNSRIHSNDNSFSKIEFFNQFASSDLDAPGPDLIVDANVTNFNGLVHLKSVTGGVQTGRNVKINANEVKIAAGRDVILSYSGGITHVGGDVKCEFDAGADCTTSDVVSGVVAGNTVSIAGEYLNINGKVQSGFADLEFEVNGTGAGDFGIWEVQKDGTRQLVNGDGQIVYHAASGDTAAYFELKPQRIAGGYIDLYGHIISTSGESQGSLDVMDGYGRIKLTNNTDIKVMVDGLSAGTGVVGRIRITDLDHDLAGKNNTKITEYTYNRFDTDGTPVNYKITWEEGDTDIVDAQGIVVEAANNPFSTANAFYQDSVQNVSDNGLAYRPLEDQYYSWENFVAKGFDDSRSVERETILGLFSNTTKAPVYGDTITTITSGEPIKDELVFVFSDAERAAISGNVTGDYFNTFETVGVTATPWVSSNYDKDEYVVYRLETWDETRSRTNSDYTKHFVQASNPISINFSGYSEGEISLLSTTTGGWDIAGDLRNTTGVTTISTTGAVTQSDASALISARQLSLAGQSFGSSTGKGTASPIFNPLRFDIAERGRLFDVLATDGDVILEHPNGNFFIGDISAVNGDVWLSSGGDILNDKVNHPAEDNVVSGNRVSLNAEFGSIGSIDAAGNIDFIRVNSQATTDGGVDAVAADEIAITETAGDLYLRRANASASDADVHIDIQNGSLVDNNEIERRDERTIADLLGLWDEMEFITETTGTGDTNSIGGTSETHEVGQRNVENYEANKTAEYERYWSFRNQLDDPNASAIDTTVTLSEAEANQLAEHFAGQLNKDVADQEVLDAVSAVELERSDEFMRLDSLYAELGNTFIEGFSYELDVNSKTYSDLTGNAGWTELELLARFGPGMLKAISDTDIRIEDANVTGRNVSLSVNNGDVGIFSTDTILIDLNDIDRLGNGDGIGDFTDLSKEQKLALLTAERKDVRFDENSYDAARGTFTRMFISTYDDVDVEVGGTLSITAPTADRIYIGSESDLDLNGIVGSSDVRIRTEGNLTSSAADGVADIIGKDIILESSGQSIGSAGDYFRISHLTGGSLTARAGDSIWLEAMNDELAIDTVFAKNLFTLQTFEDVVDFEPDAGVDIRVASLSLDIGGAFGANGLNESLDITLNPNGILVGDVAEGAFITSPDQNLRIGNFTVAATSVISSNQDIYLDSEQRDLTRTVLNAAGEEEEFVYLTTEEKGLVSTAGSMTLIANGSILDEGAGARAIEVLELDLISGNGDIGAMDNTLDINVAGSRGVSALAANGAIYIESPDNDLRLRSVAAGDTSALTSDADILLVNSGVYRATAGTLALQANGSILDESGDSVIEAADLSLLANNGTVGSTDRSLHVDTDSISTLSAATGVYLTEVNGDMNISNLYNGTGDVVLNVPEADAWLNISGGIVDGNMRWTADNILVNNLVHGGNEDELYFDVTSSTGGMADDVSITYQSDNKVRFNNLEAMRALISGDVSDLRFDHVLIGESGLFTNDTTSVFFDHVNNYLSEQYTIQLYSKGTPFFLNFLPNRRMIETDAFVLYYDSDWIVNAFSSENSLSRLVSKELSYLTGPIPDVEVEQPEEFDEIEMNAEMIYLPNVDEASSLGDIGVVE